MTTVAHAKPRETNAPSRLSVIVPALNEEDRIRGVLERALYSKPWELIVADGCSNDGTCEVAASCGARIIVSQPGRARQMNAGAAVATGDALLFLHADTLLPRGYERHVLQILASPGVIAGAFHLRIDAPRLSLRIIERLVAWRSRILQMPYGDQTLFLTRDAFERVGGFPDLAVMEDFELVRRLKRMGRINIAPASVATSARRWLDGGIWKTTLLNQVCIAAYRLGVPSRRIASWRPATNPSRVRPSASPKAPAADAETKPLGG